MTSNDDSIEIRASDAERQGVVATLQAACLEGRLTLDEYSQRVELALAARVRPQLQALLVDLPAGTDVPPAGQRRTASPVRGGPVSTTVAVLGSAQRSGFWRLAEASRVVAVLGSCKVDLRSARVSGPVTHIDVSAVLGSVDVIVPSGVEVELEAHAIVGSRDMRVAGAPPATGAPLIRISGIVLLGSLTVRDASAETHPTHIDTYG